MHNEKGKIIQNKDHVLKIDMGERYASVFIAAQDATVCFRELITWADNNKRARLIGFTQMPVQGASSIVGQPVILAGLTAVFELTPVPAEERAGQETAPGNVLKSL